MTEQIQSKRTWTNNPLKLNKIELIKLNTDGLDILNKLKYYQQKGFAAISEAEKELLKWAGIYLQRPRSEGYFMMRVKVPSGIMTSSQARTLCEISRQHGRSIIDLTTRQSIQFHWLTVESLPDVIEKLSHQGLDTVEGCGDCPRNIIGNPLSGIDPNETIDTRKIVREVFDYFQMNREFSNLPRKFKISISANLFNAGHAEINDLAFTPALKKIGNEETKGFHVYVGGGLAALPHLAQKLDIFVRPEDVLKVSIGVATIFRDFGYREKRQRARLKFLVADWGREKFQSELQKLVGPLLSSGDDLERGWNAGYFNGVHPQKQPGLNYVGLSVPLGRLSAEALENLATLADQYGDGFLRTSNSKNIILSGIPDEKIIALLKEPLLQQLKPFTSQFIAHMVTCTGKEFCNLALVETKKHAQMIGKYLDEKLELETPVRIHVSGCKNSCGQLQIADIGLRGSLAKINGQMVEGYEIQIGGALVPKYCFSTELEGFTPKNVVSEALEQLLLFFKNNRINNESFHEFVQRNGTEVFQELLNIFLATSNKAVVATTRLQSVKSA